MLILSLFVRTFLSPTVTKFHGIAQYIPDDKVPGSLFAQFYLPCMPDVFLKMIPPEKRKCLMVFPIPPSGSKQNRKEMKVEFIEPVVLYIRICLNYDFVNLKKKEKEKINDISF